MVGPHAGSITRPEVFFFDLDGTLTDPFVGITNCIRFAVTELELPAPDAADLGWCIGPPLRESFVHLVGEGRADRAVDLYRERFAEVGLFENSKYSRVEELLNNIREMGCFCYVASSKPLVFVERILTHFKLAPFFAGVFGAELSGVRSDKTELLAWALEKTGAEAAMSVMIGDRQHDALGALNNGMRAWGAGWGYGSQEELQAAGVEAWFAEVGELVDFLKADGRG